MCGYFWRFLIMIALATAIVSAITISRAVMGISGTVGEGAFVGETVGAAVIWVVGVGLVVVWVGAVVADVVAVGAVVGVMVGVGVGVELAVGTGTEMVRALRKARRSSSVPLSVKLPPKRIREKFLIIYELEGCQKAVNYLTKYYDVRRMSIFLNGRKVGKSLRWMVS
jgi:hypothetical protein